MNLNFSRLDDSQVEQAFEILRLVGERLIAQGRRQRISHTTIEQYRQWQTEKANFVVTENSEIIGLATLRFENLDEWPVHSTHGPVLMLRALATHPNRQGRGVGAFAICELVRGNVEGQAIYLDCVSDSLPQYYAKFGFKSIGQQSRTYPDGESYNITLMRLD